MNNAYNPNPVFPNQMPPTNQQPSQFTPAGLGAPFLPLEQSYIENILRLNTGKLITVYMSFTDSQEGRDKAFTGVLEDAGLDHIILSDPKTGTWYLLRSIYMDYITADEKINFSPRFPTQ